MSIETNVSGFIAGKFNEIRSRVPVKLNGFLGGDASARSRAESFEEQLAASAAANETGHATDGRQDKTDVPVEELIKNTVVVFPNIKAAPEDPEPEPEAAGRAGQPEGADPDGGDPDGGADDYADDPFYIDNYLEYGIDDYDWNANAWDNYSAYGVTAGDVDIYGYGNWDADDLYDDAYGGAYDRYAGGGTDGARQDAYGGMAGALMQGLTGDTSGSAQAQGYAQAQEYAPGLGHTQAQGVTGAVPGAPHDTLRANIDHINRRGDTQTRRIIEDAIQRASAQYGIDHNLIRAIITQESSFSPNSLSSAGAQGLMQLMPDTAASLGVGNPWDIYENIDGGTRYIRKHLENYNGDLSLALAAYNAGSGAVRRFNGVPPYKETQDYIKKVIGYYEQYTVGGI